MKIGLYCRVSSEMQKKDGLGLEIQLKDGIKFCKRFNYEWEEYKEDVSGGVVYSERSEFDRLMDDLYSKKINGVYVYDISRVLRDDRLKWMFVDMIKDSKSKLWSGGKEIDVNNDEDLLIVGIYSLFSDYERKKIRRRMLGGRRVNWRNGVGFGGNLMFGYKRKEVNGDIILVKDKDECKIVERLYKRFVKKDCKSVVDLKKYCDKYNIDIRYGRLKNILGSEIYNRGYMELYDKELKEKFKFKCDVIINDDLNNKVKEKLNRVVRFRKGNGKEDYLLKGKVNCKCGRNMWLRGSKSKDGKRNYKYYMCNSDMNKWGENLYDNKSKKDIKCKYKSRIRVDVLDDLIWTGVRKFLDDSDELKKEYEDRFKKKLGNKNEYIGKVKYYNEELNKWNERKSNSVSLILDGILSKDDYEDWYKSKYWVNVNKINKRLIELDKDLKELEVNEVEFGKYIDLMRDDLEKEFSKVRFKEKKKVLDKYLDNIFVENVVDNKNWNIFVKLFYDKNRNFLINDSIKNKDYILRFNEEISKLLMYKIDKYLNFKFYISKSNKEIVINRLELN